MANANRYYKTPFAESGNKAEVPNVSVGGAVGYDSGFGPDYELPQGSPSRKRIERDLYNGMHFGITKNLKQWQEGLYPTWIEDDGTGVAFAYPQGMIVSHAGLNWVSNEDANQEEPGIGVKWSEHVEDWMGFTEALLAEAGITPSGVPDTAVESQRLDALFSIHGGTFNSVNSMQLSTSVKDGNHLSSPSTRWKVSTVSKGISVALFGSKYANCLHEVFVEDFGFVDDFDPDTMTGTDNTQAVKDAIAALPSNVVMLTPTKDVGGGGVVVLPSTWVHITDEIELFAGVILKGASKNATVLYQSQNKDAIRLTKNPASTAQIYTINNIEVSNMTIAGADGSLTGITQRDDTNCYSISECSFKNLAIIGFKAAQHIFGGWNNYWETVYFGDFERYRSTRIGIIAETCENGVSYGVTGDTRVYDDPAGGFNSNVFVNCVFANNNRIGFFLRAISASHAYSNVFIGCNFEAIKYQTGQALTLAPYTDNIIQGATTVWDGRPVGFIGLGRVAGTSITGGGYFEDIESDGVGTGVIWHDNGIEFSPGVSKCYSNTVTDGVLFNANVPRTVHYAGCDYCGTDSIIPLNEAGEGLYVESFALAAFAQDHIIYMETGSPKQIIYDYVNRDGVRVSNTDERIEREGSNVVFERKRATETSVAYYDLNERYAIGGGKRKFAKDVSTDGGAELQYEYVEVSSTSSPRQGLKGFPLNGGKFTIPNGTTGSILISHDNAQGDNDMPTFCTVLTAASGISQLWTERSSGTSFILHFTGTAAIDTDVSYMYFGL